jgi:oligopeptide transport system substrate-binding protein
MKQLLDPAMANYRANNYYDGDSALAGAYKYYYSLSDGMYPALNAKYATWGAAVEALGEDHIYVDMWNLWGLKGKVDAEGNECPQWVLITDTVKYRDDSVPEGEEGDWISAAEVYAAAAAGGYTTDQYFPDYGGVFSYFVENNDKGFTWDGVGLYKVDEYTIRYVCENQYEYNYFLTSCTSNWLVHEKLYEKCKNWENDVYTSTYGTSKETTMSYGAYKMSSFQEGKQVVFVQNEAWYGYQKTENGYLYSITNFAVDGELRQQYQTQKIVIDVMTGQTAYLDFMSGKLDDYAPKADEIKEFVLSTQLYQVDETYTMRLFYNTNLDALKEMDKSKGNQNSVVMSNAKFREAFSLSVDRADWVTATAGYKPAYYLLNNLYFYDVYNDPASIYRNTKFAKQAVLDLYGVSYGKGTNYETIDDAYAAVTGYNLDKAKQLMKQACDELVADKLYTKGEPIKIKLGWKKAALEAEDNAQVAKLQEYINKAVEGSGFGAVTLEAVGGINDRYAGVYEGDYAIGYGAWGGAAFYPFTTIKVYMDPDHTDLHEAACWNPTKEVFTLKINGKDETMTYQQWAQSLSGTGKYANESNEVKCEILAALEGKFLSFHYCMPLATSTICSLISYKVANYTENYSIMYGFGGMRLMTFEYTDAEWADYVASQNNKLNYS